VLKAFSISQQFICILVENYFAQNTLKDFAGSPFFLMLLNGVFSVQRKINMVMVYISA